MNRIVILALALASSGCARRTAVVVAPQPSLTPGAVAVATPISPKSAAPGQSASEPAAPALGAKAGTGKAGLLRAIARLRTASPAANVEAAWANKDTRFVGVRGITTDAPGVPPDRKYKLMERYGVNAVEGTTDFITSPETAQLNAVATRYATAYNQLLLRKLDAQSDVTGD